MEEELKQNLRLLHHFNVLHMDIKNENICYSPSLNKHVFIDYGFSRIVSETKGYKTLTRFRGSLLYCSK
jgi:serine/threonine protein kinase